MVLLEDKVTLWLSTHPGSTSDQVAVGVHARKKSVLEVLSGPQFVHVVSGKRTLYRLRGAAAERPGTAQRGRETDKEFLHRLLSDGEPHNLNEILQRSFRERGCGLTVHSRVSDLRRDGLSVTHWKDGERGAGSWYRLLPLETVTDGGSAAVPHGPVLTPPACVSVAVSSGPEADGAGVQVQPAQLVLTGREFRRSAA